MYSVYNFFSRIGYLKKVFHKLQESEELDKILTLIYLDVREKNLVLKSLGSKKSMIEIKKIGFILKKNFLSVSIYLKSFCGTDIPLSICDFLKAKKINIQYSEILIENTEVKIELDIPFSISKNKLLTIIPDFSFQFYSWEANMFKKISDILKIMPLELIKNNENVICSKEEIEKIEIIILESQINKTVEIQFKKETSEYIAIAMQKNYQYFLGNFKITC